jgi:two-component system NtrC family response regulator
MLKHFLALKIIPGGVVLPEARILIIDDEVEVGTFFRRLLQKKGYGVNVALNGEEANRLIQENKFNAALVDLKLPDTDGLYLLQQIKKIQPSCEVVIMTGYSTTRTAVKAIQLGAFDYLEKPFDDIEELEKLIQSAVEYGLRSHEGRPVTEWSAVADRIGFQVGTSQVMRKLVSIAYRIAKKNINVLIQGETGTGKEVLARFIHASSNRVNQVFIPVNCGALPENLLESELFGHEKGSFTGAANLRKGIFELANRGTLFLDEIGEASLAIQVKLLRVLETGEFLRVGGEKPVKTDVRVIAATNTDLEKALKDKTFREDLFYRLDVVRLQLPPLREHREDIPLLVEYFVKKSTPELCTAIDTMSLLCNYPWPGNIRELANTISQAAALCDGDTILPEHLSGKIFLAAAEKPAMPDQVIPARDGKQEMLLLQILESLLLEECCGSDVLDKIEEGKLAGLLDHLKRLENEVVAAIVRKGAGTLRPSSLGEAEARAIREALSYSQGNIASAARALGIGRNTLYRKMKEYDIKG